MATRPERRTAVQGMRNTDLGLWFVLFLLLLCLTLAMI